MTSGPEGSCEVCPSPSAAALCPVSWESSQGVVRLRAQELNIAYVEMSPVACQRSPLCDRESGPGHCPLLPQSGAADCVCVCVGVGVCVRTHVRACVCVHMRVCLCRERGFLELRFH